MKIEMPSFDTIIEVLKKYDPDIETRKGEVAGQAVASAIQHLLYGEELIINDIDIFESVEYQEQSTVEDGFIPMIQSSCAMSGSSFVGYMIDRYMSYHIIETTTAGIINTIKVRRMSHNEIIEGFDLNCVEASIDLQSKTVHVTNEYLDFLANREIKVTRTTTPAHTFMRAVKKSKSLQHVTINLDAVAEVCITALECIHSHPFYAKYDLSQCDSFGQKYIDCYRAHPEIAEYFELVSINDSFSKLKPKRAGRSDWIELSTKLLALPKTQELKTYCGLINNSEPLLDMLGFYQLSQHENAQEFFNQIEQIVSHDTLNPWIKLFFAQYTIEEKVSLDLESLFECAKILGPTAKRPLIQFLEHIQNRFKDLQLWDRPKDANEYIALALGIIKRFPDEQQKSVLEMMLTFNTGDIRYMDIAHKLVSVAIKKHQLIRIGSYSELALCLSTYNLNCEDLSSFSNYKNREKPYYIAINPDGKSYEISHGLVRTWKNSGLIDSVFYYIESQDLAPVIQENKWLLNSLCFKYRMNYLRSIKTALKDAWNQFSRTVQCEAHNRSQIKIEHYEDTIPF